MKDEDLKVESLWLFDRRDNLGKQSNDYHGNFIPQIPNQLIRRYSKEKQLVLELFSGSGTTLFECEKLNRKYIGFDINEDENNIVLSKMKGSCVDFCLCNCDLTNSENFSKNMNSSLSLMKAKKVDFLIAHPPYMDIVKFSEKKEDLSNISDLNTFLSKLKICFDNALAFLGKNKYFAVIMGDIYKNSEVIPLAFKTMELIKESYQVKLKGIVIKNIEGNRGKIGTSALWRARALRSDYFIFKHEYIFVFKKEF